MQDISDNKSTDKPRIDHSTLNSISSDWGMELYSTYKYKFAILQ